VKGLYDNPVYYEIAFSFFDPAKQAGLIERFVRRHSRRKVRRILDICCGPSFQLREFARRGYDCIGLDGNAAMLRHLRERGEAAGVRISTVRGDLREFRLRPRADLALIMMGSLGALSSNREFLAHLESVGKSLNPGSLYLIENFPFLRAGTDASYGESWVRRRGGILVRTSYLAELADAFAQTSRETIRMDVRDGVRRRTFVERGITKAYGGAELLGLLEKNGRFDLVGVFERSSLRPIRNLAGLNMVVLRRKRA